MFPQQQLNHNNKKRRFLFCPHRDIIKQGGHRIDSSRASQTVKSKKTAAFQLCERVHEPKGRNASEVKCRHSGNFSYAMVTVASGVCN
jgi:hypothetical protein